MISLPENELQKIGFDTASGIIGEGKILALEVVTMPDSTDELAHYFTFQVQQDPDLEKAALARVALALALRDRLLARGDERYPFLRVLSAADWGRR